MWQMIKEDRRANNKVINIAGRRVLMVFRFGQWRMTIKPKLLRAPFSVIYRFMERRVRFKYGIELPYTVKLGERVVFEHQHGIVIHGNCVIGDDCIIRQGVTLGNRYLDRPYDAPVLGNGVSVGAGAKLLGSINIGDHVTIGANAVVLHDVPSGKTVVGIPARVIS